MQIVVAEDVLVPVFVLNLEHWLLKATDEALIWDFDLNFSLSVSLRGKGINDDAEENIHEDDVDYQEEKYIKVVSICVNRVTIHSLVNYIGNSSSSSDALLNGKHKALS